MKQQSSFKSQVKPFDMKALTLASLKMAQIALQKNNRSLNFKMLYCRVLKLQLTLYTEGKMQ